MWEEEGEEPWAVEWDCRKKTEDLHTSEVRDGAPAEVLHQPSVQRADSKEVFIELRSSESRLAIILKPGCLSNIRSDGMISKTRWSFKPSRQSREID